MGSGEDGPRGGEAGLDRGRDGPQGGRAEQGRRAAACWGRLASALPPPLLLLLLPPPPPRVASRPGRRSGPSKLKKATSPVHGRTGGRSVGRNVAGQARGKEGEREGKTESGRRRRGGFSPSLPPTPERRSSGRSWGASLRLHPREEPRRATEGGKQASQRRFFSAPPPSFLPPGRAKGWSRLEKKRGAKPSFQARAPTALRHGIRGCAQATQVRSLKPRATAAAALPASNSSCSC